MALIRLDGTWNGKTAVTVPNDKAREIKRLLMDLPGDLPENKYDFLKAVKRIHFGDGSTWPQKYEQASQTALGAVSEGYKQDTQGRAMAYGRDD